MATLCQERSRARYARRTLGAATYPQTYPQRFAEGRVGGWPDTCEAPDGDCHPPSPCERRPARGFDDADVRRRGRARQRFDSQPVDRAVGRVGTDRGVAVDRVLGSCARTPRCPTARHLDLRVWLAVLWMRKKSEVSCGQMRWWAAILAAYRPALPEVALATGVDESPRPARTGGTVPA
jgi:hypothetical protein